jgi:hypothetical protein
MLAPMHGWEAVMAALGGLLLGLGLGVGSTRRRNLREADELARRVRELEHVAIPWLRARAEALGAPPQSLERDESEDALATARALFDTIQRLEREDLLPYNDTMELEAMALTRDTAPKRGLPR